MTIEVYAVRLSGEPEAGIMQQLNDCVSEEKQAKAARLKQPADRCRTLVGEALARWLIGQRWGLRPSDIRYIYNAYGKPSLDGFPNIHFNVSHSGEWVVCAISEQPVGVDIERQQYIDFSWSYHYFATEEAYDLQQRPFAERLSYFYDLWTLKESFIKQRGVGLSLPLDRFAVRVTSEGNPVLLHSPDLKEYWFKQYPVDGPYKLAVCGQERDFAEELVVLPFDTFMSSLGSLQLVPQTAQSGEY
ncbi:4'-phosphopantetheinyl transferase family protein [Paenibacillus ehimensis]|uniref:4'-phosphopantetheinyl transferase superfamily protein n=1 Tax=Paenibacillus ehimensis TaxID=79264 RepID=A0ABT8V8E6_9BACL|nr:4'-phosphopantetheinyl transferase superfamily protein [Paenibacillus ehimensis]MDO3677728.1 4'-phosphopantetheinyl transferase superfamily protein [Paenibacillus ehimensis]